MASSEASVSIRNLALSFGSVQVLNNLNLDIADGEFLVLLGSSGCGKSTLLNCIAGLLDVSDGQVYIKGRNVTWDEPKDRDIGMVFQSYALYPQMTVQGNLSFGLKNAGMGKQDVARRVQHAAEVLQIQPLLGRKPAQLSGGQRQRVAIGRALVREVDVFLFDEPLSNLDAKLRAELRVEIKRLHQKLKNTMVYVTHDQVEAMTLADRIAVMKDGGIQQLAAPYDIYNKPVNKFVAGFIGSPGINFLVGELSSSHAPLFHAHGTDIVLDGYVFDGVGRRDGAVLLGIRPEHVLSGTAAQDAPVKADVSVEVVEPMGSDTLVWTSLAGQEFRFRVDGQSRLQPGDSTHIGLYPGKACLFDANSERRL